MMTRRPRAPERHQDWRMQRSLLFAMVVTILAGISSTRMATADDWRLYQNDRYGTTIDYQDIFKPEPPPDNDDGRSFKSADGADFSVFASYNALDFDLAGFREFTMKNLDASAVVTYQAHGDNWFVVSGTKGAGRIFYERHILSHGGQMTEGFVMSYPAAGKQKYDPIVARMAKSFRPGTGFQTPDKH
jgi:hypothetical protein